MHHDLKGPWGKAILVDWNPNPYGSRPNLVNGIMTEWTNDLRGSAPEEEYTGSSGGGTEKKINTPC